MGYAAGLYYETHGADAAPPLILSSGLGGSANYWKPNIQALAEHYRVIAYDHRGTGRSDRALPDVVTVDDFADDILALMDALSIERAHIVGHAAGGVAGLALAMKAPDRLDKLVVVNGWAKADPHFLRCFETRLALLRGSGPEAYVRAQPLFLYPITWLSGGNADRLAAEEATALEHFPGIPTMEKRIAALANFDITDRLDSLTTRTMLIAAHDDMLVPIGASDRLYAGLPNATHAFMRWGAHACNVTDPERFNEIVVAWLADEVINEEYP